ncbi:MAG: DNA-3-methyladenine glycosylase 2 family protein [Armatimonadetes bacterium]|nr:DNA-3-methyladenine glycosylase 2 family protein [Armatimonadota bacterium]
MSIEAAEKHLATVEPKFASLIQSHGSCVLVDEGDERTIYEALMRAILFQQLSGKAASTIRDRLYALFPEHQHPPHEKLVLLTVEEFRAVGVSRQKAGYLQDLASKAPSIPTEEELHTLSDDDIIDRLVPIKGVGRWTVEMLLMFKLGRLDVLPVDDMGVQEGVRRFYGLEKRPKRKEMEALTETWRPYRSVGSWYMWRVCDDKTSLELASK